MVNNMLKDVIILGKALSVLKSKNDGKQSITDDLTIVDRDWVNCRFMVPNKDLSKTNKKVRDFTSYALKFTDTSLGGNIAINNKAQYTRYCDIRAKGRVPREKVSTNITTGNHGMGRYYSEAIDDNQQRVFFQFGVPEFNSLFSFFTRAIDYRDLYVANKGKFPVLYQISKSLAEVSMLVAYPMITAIIWLGKGILSFFTNGDFNFYYLNPTMHTYWGVVNTIVTNIAVDLGILAPELMPENDNKQVVGMPVKFNQEHMNELKKLLPGLIGETNYIDVFAIATKCQTVTNRQVKYEYEMIKNGKDQEYGLFDYMLHTTDTKNVGATQLGMWDKLDNFLKFGNYLKEVTKQGEMFAIYDEEEVDEEEIKKREDNKEQENKKPMKQYTKDDDGFEPLKPHEDNTWGGKFVRAFDAGVRQGGAWAVFNVDAITSVTDTFTNNTSEIDTGSTLKSISKKVRDLKFDFAGGNIVDGMGAILDSVGQVLRGQLDASTFGLSNVIATMFGNSYIDIPLKWEDSEARGSDISLTIQLRSPYGDPFSQLQNIYIPLAMLLAGSLPQSTGNSSYTSPFLCNFYSKGIGNIDLAIISSLTITRGVTNLPFSRSRRPLGIDVNLTVKNLSNILATPTNSSLWNGFKVNLKEDSVFAQYMGSVVGRALLEYRYIGRRMLLKYSRMRMIGEGFFSPANWGLLFGEKAEVYLGGFAADTTLPAQQL